METQGSSSTTGVNFILQSKIEFYSRICNNKILKVFKRKYCKHILSRRVFCKKGCNADGDTLEECLSLCDEICYKDPVLKDQQWSAYTDRSPGSASYLQVFISSDSHSSFMS
ncbi:hypothetical protein Tco_1118290 [Tanacetum coccineum]